MTYPEALDYLYSRLPVFHRIGPKALKPGLGNIERLCAALGNPQNQFRGIHVGGTNGKGSSAHMLAAIYQSAGYRTGLYTSPHLKSFTERIRLDGLPIAEADVAAFVAEHQALIEAIEPSFFEVTVALAFDFFARQRVDLAIVEVGLGGRLDSTNILTPVVSVITNIGLDHTDVLGDSLPQIAREKAGIIKANVPVVVGETQADTEAIFRQVAASLHAPLTFADQHYAVADLGLTNARRQVRVSRPARAGPQPNGMDDGTGSGVFALDLIGTYQLRNLPAVLATVAVLQPVLPVSAADRRAGLRSVVARTGLRGRFQILAGGPPRVLVDTAHNAPGIAALRSSLQSLTYTGLHVVIGLVADKDRRDLLLALPTVATYYFCQRRRPVRYRPGSCGTRLPKRVWWANRFPMSIRPWRRLVGGPYPPI